MTATYRYDGKAVGGPCNDGRLEADCPRVTIPLQVPGQPGFFSGQYVFNELLGIWLWEGKWPPRLHREKRS
jgi:hypothetical protein